MGGGRGTDRRWTDRQGRGRRARWLALALLGMALAQTQPTPTQPMTPPTTQPALDTPTPQVAPDAPAPDAPADGTDDTGTSVSLTRTAKDGRKRLITVQRTGTSDATGIFTACQPLDDDPPGTPTISVFSESGAGGVRVSIDKNVIVAPLAIVTQQDSGDGHIEVSAGTARYLDAAPPGATDRLSRCEVEAKAQPAPDTVTVTQGKTRLNGSRLVYDESDGVARIEGPITFSRQNGASTLTGTSGSIEVNVDDESTTLVGNVTLRDGSRTSTAERVEYDDTANVAILRGTPAAPARSVTSDQTLTASVIRYNLDTGSVVAVGPIGGEFQDGPAAPTQSGTPAPAAPSPATPASPSTP
ncbi:LptA/OstA family protein [Deinococcus aquiradiocola]|uniref:Organic solvent tolerance-like N-terminal domain-containing protein n=1 Tax=Deinococcus aquiradiocola TaxID=393059 RepID=A0A917PJH1_9DEIO|nr:LptA/OstA family protein [Deinococcus aquiradiocola]GGJ80992.1 hypothetical protein GCM10008939_26240 [Deinococcus aquiradiocola]